MFNVVSKIPFNEKFSGFTKLGLLAWDVELKEAGFGLIDSADGTDLTYGLGVMLNATDKVSCNLQYQMYNLDGVALDNISIGIQTSF